MSFNPGEVFLSTPNSQIILFRESAMPSMLSYPYQSANADSKKKKKKFFPSRKITRGHTTLREHRQSLASTPDSVCGAGENCYLYQREIIVSSRDNWSQRATC